MFACPTLLTTGAFIHSSKHALTHTLDHSLKNGSINHFPPHSLAQRITCSSMPSCMSPRAYSLNTYPRAYSHHHPLLMYPTVLAHTPESTNLVLHLFVRHFTHHRCVIPQLAPTCFGGLTARAIALSHIFTVKAGIYSSEFYRERPGGVVPKPFDTKRRLISELQRYRCRD